MREVSVVGIGMVPFAKYREKNVGRNRLAGGQSRD